MPPPPAAEATSFDLDVNSAGRPSLCRLAASFHFLADGMIFGTWAALIPFFKAKFGVSEATLSIVLLAIAAGAIVSMPITGSLVARHGSRRNLRYFAPGFGLSLLLLVLAPNFGLFIAAAFLFGALKGAFNVSVNTQAITVENKLRKPVIPSFHALWSFGGMLAAFAVGAAMKFSVPPVAIVLGVLCLIGTLLIIFAPHLLDGDAHPVSTNEKSPRFRLPGGMLLKIGIVTFMVLFAEGVMMDWSVVYARTVSGAEPWLAPIAYGIFAGCMATGRVFGGTLISRLGPSHLLRFGGVLCMIGLVLVTTIHHWPATFLGFALTGLGLSNLIPILFSAGGRAHEGGAGNGIAMVSMMGYFGFLVGPPVIGGVSHWAGLPGAFAIVVAFAAFIAFAGNRFLGQLPNPTKP